MKKIRLVSIGDCCVDIYPQYNKVFPGGTAFNVAVHASNTGAAASILSAIGTDANAVLLQKSFKKFDIDISHLAIMKGETSRVEVKLDGEGKPVFYHWDLGILKKYSLKEADKKFLQKHNVARIVLFKPITGLFEQFCNMKMPQTLKVADFAGSSMYSQGIKIIAKYIKNLDVIVKSLDEQDKKAFKFLKQLASDYKNKIILVLLGKSGSVVFTNGKIYKQQSNKTQVKDTNGAGDAYLAHFLVSYLKTSNVSKAMQEGTKAAIYTISHLGAVKVQNSYDMGIK